MKTNDLFRDLAVFRTITVEVMIDIFQKTSFTQGDQQCGPLSTHFKHTAAYVQLYVYNMQP